MNREQILGGLNIIKNNIEIKGLECKFIIKIVKNEYKNHVQKNK